MTAGVRGGGQGGGGRRERSGVNLTKSVRPRLGLVLLEAVPPVSREPVRSIHHGMAAARRHSNDLVRLSQARFVLRARHAKGLEGRNEFPSVEPLMGVAAARVSVLHVLKHERCTQAAPLHLLARGWKVACASRDHGIIG